MAFRIPFRRLSAEFQRATSPSHWSSVGSIVDRNFGEIEQHVSGAEGDIASLQSCTLLTSASKTIAHSDSGATAVDNLTITEGTSLGLFTVASGVVTCKQAGLYWVSFGGLFASNVNGTRRAIRLDGSTAGVNAVSCSTLPGDTTGFGVGLNCARPLRLVLDETVSMFAGQDCGISLALVNIWLSFIPISA